MSVSFGPIDYSRLEKALSKELRAKLEIVPLPIVGVLSVFVDENENIYAGLMGRAEVWRSKDGGLTWEKIFEDPEARRVNSIYVVGKRVLVGTVNPPRLYVSDDYGRSWRRVIDVPTAGYIRRIVEDSDGRLYANYAITDDLRGTDVPSRIYMSEDGGETWREVYSAQGKQWYALHYDPWQNKIYFGGSPELYRAEPGFGTVEEIISNAGTIFDITSGLGYRLWVTDDPHDVRRTFDDSSQQLVARMTPYASPSNARYRGYVGGFTGSPSVCRVSPSGTLYVGTYTAGTGFAQVFASPDFGETYRLLFSAWSRIIHDIAFDRSGYVYVACPYPRKDVIAPFRMNQGLLLKFRDVPPWELDREPIWIDVPIAQAVIRDTSTYYSMRDTYIDPDYIVCTRGYSRVAIMVFNTLDADVEVRVEGSVTPTFNYKVNVGAAFTVSAGASDYETLTDPVPYLRVAVRALTTPTTGDVTVVVVKAV